ncbi:MAG: metalloregulator ArsR/SmtB family transcription factor [Actinomycetes bacterium]
MKYEFADLRGPASLGADSANAGNRGVARVAAALLESGPATARELGDQLKLTGTAIRRHLDNLVAAGFAQASDRAPFGPTSSKPRGRGRPARVYTLTAAGQEAFGQAYDDLAISAIRFLADSGGEQAVTAFARQRADEMESRYSATVAGGSTVAARALLLARALHDDGFASAVEPTGSAGVQVCQHHCPVAKVAQQFPELCVAEAEAFGRLVGAHVTRLATLGQGDGVCTTLVPVPEADLDGDQVLALSSHAHTAERTMA